MLLPEADYVMVATPLAPETKGMIDLREDSPNSKPMREFNGNRIHLPDRSFYYPRLEALRWHREHVFGAV